jgi:polysaccharide export outer membrane protein
LFSITPVEISAMLFQNSTCANRESMNPSRRFSCAKLLLSSNREGVFSMGKAAFVGRRYLLSLAFVLLTVGSLLCGQEKPSAPPQAQSTPETVSKSQTNASQTKPADTPEANSDSDNLRFGVGDLLEISVYGVPELTTKARIGNSGDVYLPLIDYVHVDGLSPEQAQGVIEKRLSDGGFVKNPHVQIFVAENASQAITVLGEVTRPGPYPIIGERRLYDVISAAGGLSERAGRTVTISHRATPNQPVTVHLAEGLAQTAESNVPVAPGDTIVVSRAGIVYVVGDVGHPSGFVIENNNLTVLKLIALAGGTTRTSKLNGAKILRKTPDVVKETPVRLKRILQAKAPDVPVEADDILFVPGSAAKAAAYRGTESILQAATTLSIMAYRP